MKRLLLTLIAACLLVGCAATSYKNARLSANRVQNGMTVAQAVDILGIPPSITGPDFVEWRRGNAQKYDGTIHGSIRYELKDGVIVNVPQEGIFSETARQRVEARRREADEQRKARAEADALARAAQAELDAKAKAEQDAKDAAALRNEIAAEVAARQRATIHCADKTMCGKAFALAQVFVAQNADQKIQVATDTVIETYNPTEVDKVGLVVMKVPGKGTSEMLVLKPNCKESEYDRRGYFCRLRRTELYKDFRAFMDERLVR